MATRIPESAILVYEKWAIVGEKKVGAKYQKGTFFDNKRRLMNLEKCKAPRYAR